MAEVMESVKVIDWTTREELLLAYAVERYGRGDWKTVALVIQARSSLPSILVSAEACESKFDELKRRFMDNCNEEGDEEKQDRGVIFWLDELRKLRVLELKEEVRQSDLSIQRLRLKVKRLEDERDITLKVSGDHDVNLDLTERCPEEETESLKESTAACLDRNHRHSVNDSNSSDYIGDSSATIGQLPVLKRRPSQDEKRVNSAELSNETAELKLSKTVIKLDKDQKRKHVTAAVSPSTSNVKPETRSQPLVELLDVIRSHHQIRMLERRPASQNPAVRQHVDMESIRSRLDDGSYSDINKFYRDLLLFFTNAIATFPKTSSESATSYQFRDMVLNHLKDNKPEVTEPPSPVAEVVKKERSGPVLVVCRRRSSIHAKPNKPSHVVVANEKKEISEDKINSTPAPDTTKAKNDPNSMIRGMKTRVENSPEKKKKGVEDSRKRKGVVEFLKRILSKSPPEKPKGRKNDQQQQQVKNKKSGSKGRKRGREGGGKEEVVPSRIAKKPTKR